MHLPVISDTDAKSKAKRRFGHKKPQKPQKLQKPQKPQKAQKAQKAQKVLLFRFGSDLLSEMTGFEHFERFRNGENEDHLDALIHQYTPLVYSVASRRIENSALADEICQTVFLRLFQSRPHLKSEGQLLGWLHRVAVYVSTDLWRSETQRRKREEEYAMKAFEASDEVWKELEPPTKISDSDFPMSDLMMDAELVLQSHSSSRKEELEQLIHEFRRKELKVSADSIQIFMEKAKSLDEKFVVLWTDRIRKTRPEMDRALRKRNP